MDAGHVVTSIEEHDEGHLNLEVAIVVLKVLFNLGLHASEVVNLAIDALLNINAIHEVAKDDTLRIKDLLLGQLEAR